MKAKEGPSETTVASQILWPDRTRANHTNTLDRIGRKGLGLLQIPSPWRPPFFVLPTAVFRRWQELPTYGRSSILDEAAVAIAAASEKFGDEWKAGIIFRSSAVNETLLDRGAYLSKPVTADYNVNTVRESLADIFNQFHTASPNDALAVIVQPLIPGPNLYLGHMSNERRLSKTVNQWIYEPQATGLGHGFNSQRSSPADTGREIRATNIGQLVAGFRAIGRWCTTLGRGPAHIEWAWSNQKIWLLQLDFEDESPDDGFDPNVLLRPADSSVIKPQDVSPLKRIDLRAEGSGWGKVDKVGVLASVRNMPYPALYSVTGTQIKSTDDARLIDSIEKISNGRVVCRTDCVSPKISKLNLPRTNSVSPQRAVEFMRAVLVNMSKGGAEDEEVCFILHRFIAAKAAAWALADPQSQFVRIDSLWGIPDGLQFLPHDTFEYDVRRKALSAEIIRYKVAFIQETADGTWRELKILRRLGRSTSLPASDVREIATQTHELAKKMNQRIQVMWFCSIPEDLGIGRNLPWFSMKAADVEMDGKKVVGPTRQRFVVRNESDLNKCRNLTLGRHVISVNPDVDLIRNDEFLESLCSVAKHVDAPVELHGSTLAHAYYVLGRSGITVVAAGEPSRKRVRGKQTFVKLVRDRVPDQIQQHGETTVLARIPKQDSRAALVVKLFEEAQEVLKAKSPEEVQAELADLLEVVMSLASATGISWDDVRVAADDKRARRGGFEGGTVLMETAWPKGNDKAPPEQRTVPLKSLAVKKEISTGAEINFTALVADGADRTILMPDGKKYTVTLTGSSIKLAVVQEEKSAAQINLPGIGD